MAWRIRWFPTFSFVLLSITYVVLQKRLLMNMNGQHSAQVFRLPPSRQEVSDQNSQENVFVISLPGSGTDELKQYFRCGHQLEKLSENSEMVTACAATNLRLHRPMVENCGKQTVWTDDIGGLYNSSKCLYPSIEALGNLATNYPKSRFLYLRLNETRRWLVDVRPHRLIRKGWYQQCDGFPKIRPEDDEDVWMNLYTDHVRDTTLFAAKRSLRFTELIVESHDTGIALEDLFGIPSRCWPEPNQDSSTHRTNVGRNKLPTPVLALSLPKSGTTSIQKYFNCAQPRSASHHWSSLQNGSLVKHGECLGENHRHGRPMLDGCGEYITWSDMGGVYHVQNDTGQNTWDCFFPSVNGLDNIARYYPIASILHVVRDASAWYDSLSLWNNGRLMQQLAAECKGFPNTTEKDEWLRFYEEHKEKIRRFAKENPSITFIEASLEDSTTPQLLEDSVGISGTCWGDCIPDARLKKRCRFALLNESW